MSHIGTPLRYRSGNPVLKEGQAPLSAIRGVVEYAPALINDFRRHDRGGAVAAGLQPDVAAGGGDKEVTVRFLRPRHLFRLVCDKDAESFVASWLKIKNPAHSQAEGCHEFFDDRSSRSRQPLPTRRLGPQALAAARSAAYAQPAARPNRG